MHFQLEENDRVDPVSIADYVALGGKCIKTADSFYQLAGMAIVSPSFEGLASPATHSCAAFACELYLKALHILQREYPVRIHDFAELHRGLDRETRQQVYELHPKGNCIASQLPSYFDLQIQELRKAFEVFRYRYEWGSMACNIQFMFELADALRMVSIHKFNGSLENIENPGTVFVKLDILPDFFLCRQCESRGLYFHPAGSAVCDLKNPNHEISKPRSITGTTHVSTNELRENGRV